MSDLLKELNDADFDSTVGSGITLVDFWAPWCGPCQMQTPILEEVATEVGEKAAIVKVNVDDNPGAAGKLGVQSIPTLILFKDGEEVNRFIGVQQKDDLVSAIDGA